MTELLKSSQIKDLVIITTAETQMEETQFGAIPLIQRKDGNIVNQLLHQLWLHLRVEHMPTVKEIIKFQLIKLMVNLFMTEKTNKGLHSMTVENGR